MTKERSVTHATFAIERVFYLNRSRQVFSLNRFAKQLKRVD